MKVLHPLNATKLHGYVRSRPEHLERRTVLREYFKMWMATDLSKMIPGELKQ